MFKTEGNAVIFGENCGFFPVLILKISLLILQFHIYYIINLLISEREIRDSLYMRLDCFKKCNAESEVDLTFIGK